MVSNGTDVTFTCAIVTLSEGYTIGWSLGSLIVNQSNERFNVHTNFELQFEGIQTTSFLTILNVTGFDSSVVQCFTKYLPNNVLAISRAEAVLSVLGEYKVCSDRGCIR